MYQTYIPAEGVLSQDKFLMLVASLLDDSWLIQNNQNVYYYNVPAGFDIEVSSFYEGEKLPQNKRAVMYIWQFGIWNYVTTGRTWDEFISFMNVLKRILGLSESKRLIVYVHNLPYEFQFIRKRFTWDKVFLLSERKPVYAHTNGIEFRCSLKLSGGKSLEAVGKDLKLYKVAKLVGNLNHNLVRTPLTPMSDKELKYCENDVRVLLSYIQEKIEYDGNITLIPLTNTGYVRNYCRKECYRRWKKYRRIMDSLQLEPNEFSQLRRAFQGGFTHANAHYSRKVLRNVASHDFTSSYPAVMVLEKFPMSSATLIDHDITEDELAHLLLTKCCLFDIELWGVTAIRHQEHPISYSKCRSISGYTTENGRVIMADYLKTTITEQDFFIYLEFYTWDYMTISNLRVYEKQYLPKQFIMAILELYKKKTVLKGIKGEELNYLIIKGMLNAGYGMTVTNPVRDILEYLDDKYTTDKPNLEKAISKYNKSLKRFLFYPWGVWVTAYARANLFSGIIALGDDYLYSDTDSLKSINTERHADYFKQYNASIKRKIAKVSEHYNIPVDYFSPCNQDGEVQTIGLWDYEGTYDKFKTIGAKRYITMRFNPKQDDIIKFYESGMKIEITNKWFTVTVAGTNKKKTMEYLIKSGDIFNNFDDGMTVPKEYSGRLVMTYIDFETRGTVVDYLGKPYNYYELTSIHMEPTEYKLSMTEDYIKYLEGFKDIEMGYDI